MSEQVAGQVRNRYALLTKPLMEAVYRRLTVNNVLRHVNAVVLADMIERTERPYLIVSPLAESTTARTNKNRYVKIEFQLELVCDTFDEIDEKLGVLREYVENAPLDFSGEPKWAGLAIQSLFSGEATFTKMSEQWLGIQQYAAEMSQHYVSSPA